MSIGLRISVISPQTYCILHPSKSAILKMDVRRRPSRALGEPVPHRLPHQPGCFPLAESCSSGSDDFCECLHISMVPQATGSTGCCVHRHLTRDWADWDLSENLPLERGQFHCNVSPKRCPRGKVETLKRALRSIRRLLLFGNQSFCCDLSALPMLIALSPAAKLLTASLSTEGCGSPAGLV